MAAAYRDRFPLKVSWQGAGLEQTDAAGGPIVREVERVCGRLRRSQSRRRVAVRAEVPWAAKVLRGLEPSCVIGERDGRASGASGRTPE